VKTFAKSLKSGQTPQTYKQKWRQTCFQLRNWCENHMKTFSEVIHNPVLNAVHRRWLKIFLCKFGEIWEKSFASLKMCVLLHIWHCNSICFTFYVFPTQPAQHFSSYIPHGPQQKVLCSAVRSADWPTIGQRPTVFRPPTYSVIGSIPALALVKSVKFSLDNPGTRSGPDLAEARPLPYPLVRPPSPTVTRKKWKRVNQFAQIRK